ncbi:hypothetical protein [Endozoicomonas sp. ONNA1]|uniref:hypothetical protein n=1 Tax=Endozoicomonas sp. ONNA1 TaxID=2828740 RepID=UPI0021480075|nr:hypothetical protein [Endozoicomonas sp. ONNA1]
MKQEDMVLRKELRVVLSEAISENEVLQLQEAIGLMKGVGEVKITLSNNALKHSKSPWFNELLQQLKELKSLLET